MKNLPCQNKKYVLKIIDVVKRAESDRARDPEDVYLNGNCGNLYSHLKSVFHCAKPVVVYACDRNWEYAPVHIKTAVGQHCYDIESSTTKFEDPKDPNDPTVIDEVRGCSDNYTLNNPPSKFWGAADIMRYKSVFKDTEKENMAQTAIIIEDFVKDGGMLR